ncbi:MAG TPA: 2,3-bisphosphoglycerate-independent phosphoglycerate mutase [Casimicrobiaceae bacterium]|nr:2,3-bisphosphoglycerate-independent phosphoglycerate mutase [Casimicrobiaceae bacterium]
MTDPPAASAAIVPVVLLILDGVGCRVDAPDNAVSRAAKPNWDRLWREHAHTRIDASQRAVGLPAGQMGNSEVGHFNIGAGRVVYQEFTRIDRAIETGEFARNPALAKAVATARDHGSTLHVLGLVSPGGVHSHERQLAAMVEMAAQGGAPRVAVHAFLDGRDTPPKSAAGSLGYMNDVCARHQGCRVADIVGRYYAMDRDQRWDRIEAAYDLIVDARAPYSAPDAASALAAAYARGESDEFVEPTTIAGGARIGDGDVVVFMNFRADRARQMTRALTDPGFSGFARKRVPRLGAFVTLTSYGKEFAALPVAFPPQTIADSFGAIVAARGLKQLRIAETEKYAHVTYFFNGGVETPYPGEDRILVPSPKVATYDLKPEMSAVEVTDRLVGAIESRRYDAVVCNYANGDMVGHTGNLTAATRAIETLDACVGRVAAAQLARGGEVLVTADHGNAEKMHDERTGQPHTAHTLNLVPCLYIGRPATARGPGALQDIAPTLLAIMGLPKPPEMTGRALFDIGK